MKKNKVPRYRKKIITVETIALKKGRELKGLNRREAGALLGVSFKQIEQVENGRVELTQNKIEKYLKAYSISKSQFQLICDGKFEAIKKHFGYKKEKVIENNCLRRSYKKIISKEVETLIALRKLKGLSQYEAGQKCGYARCTIGHIENGRIEIPKSRLVHIVEAYGFSVRDFEHHCKSERLITNIQEECINIVKNMDRDKLKAVYGLLKNF